MVLAAGLWTSLGRIPDVVGPAVGPRIIYVIAWSNNPIIVSSLGDAVSARTVPLFWERVPLWRHPSRDRLSLA